MNLKYQLSDILIRDELKINDSTLNKCFSKLILNDYSICDNGENEPRIWECRWYNDDGIAGYLQGEAFWINTDDIDGVIGLKHSQIYEYASNNPFLKSIIKPYVYGDVEILLLYRSILSGYVNKKEGIYLSALYEIGDIHNSALVRVSKVDNNKHSIFDDLYWDDFFYTKTCSDTSSVFDDILNHHLIDYHLSGIECELEKYADISLSNVSPVQRIYDHTCDYHRSVLTGLDYICKCNRINVDSDKISTLISSEDMISVWYELSTGKVYTFNNSIAKDKISEKLSDVTNFDKISKFIPSESDCGFGNVTFSLTITDSENLFGLNYPNRFKYDDDTYLKVKDILSLYYVSEYTVGNMSADSVDGLLISSYYTIKTPETVSSLSDIEEFYRDRYMKKFNIIGKTETRVLTTTTKNVLSTWISEYASGVCQLGGMISVDSHQSDRIITVKLDVPYRYASTQFSLYGDVNRISENIEYSQENNLGCMNHYTINLIPICELYIEGGNLEIVGIRNDSFDIFVGKNVTCGILYVTYGIKGNV